MKIDKRSGPGIRCDKTCGFGCTQAAFDQATAEAYALAKSLGSGWKIRVWENWGWNYEVVLNCLVVKQDRDGDPVKGGWALKPRFTAHTDVGQIWKDGRTPKAAIRKVYQQILKNHNEVELQMGQVMNALIGMEERR